MRNSQLNLMKFATPPELLFFSPTTTTIIPKLRYAFHALRCPSGCQGVALVVHHHNDTATPRPTKLKNPSLVCFARILLGTFMLLMMALEG